MRISLKIVKSGVFSGIKDSWTNSVHNISFRPPNSILPSSQFAEVILSLPSNSVQSTRFLHLNSLGEWVLKWKNESKRPNGSEHTRHSQACRMSSSLLKPDWTSLNWPSSLPKTILGQTFDMESTKRQEFKQCYS